jgi:hypothetical protein
MGSKAIDDAEALLKKSAGTQASMAVKIRGAIDDLKKNKM